jgi:hypothetical protein
MIYVLIITYTMMAKINLSSLNEGERWKGVQKTVIYHSIYYDSSKLTVHNMLRESPLQKSN